MAPATEPEPAKGREGRWSLTRLGVVLYPFVAAAAAINIFLCALMLRAVGLPNVEPVTALWLGALAGFPATWATARWVRGLMDQAEE